MLDWSTKIGHRSNVPVEVSVSEGPLPSSLTDVNIVNRGVFERQKNGITILANDATSFWFNPSKTFYMQ